MTPAATLQPRSPHELRTLCFPNRGSPHCPIALRSPQILPANCCLRLRNIEASETVVRANREPKTASANDQQTVLADSPNETKKDRASKLGLSP